MQELEPKESDRPRLPTGTVTFLFTDIEGSTRLLLRLGPDYPLVLAEHREILRDVFAEHGGIELGTEGDSFFVAFARASDAAAAALEGQRRLAAYAWPQDAPLRVRMGLHTGEVSLSASGSYTGLPVHEAARISSSAHGGQILMSQVASELMADTLPPGAYTKDLGVHRLKDLPLPQRIFQLGHPDVRSDFPPIRTLGAADRLLPVQPTPLVGRDKEVASVIDTLRASDVRLVTLTGPGGIGKTRLAVEVASRVAADFEEGVVYVPLASVRHSILVISSIGMALGVRESEEEALLENVMLAVKDKSVLLLLDNFEQVIDAAADVARLLSAASRIKILVTSRTVLNVRGEAVISVPPLEPPPDIGRDDLERVAGNESVRLFVERATAARSDFELDRRNVGAVAGICRKLDGLPLAIELAAARVRVLPPRALYERLNDRLSMLTAGSRDLPDRQQTLRNAIDWSYDLLGEDERQLLADLAVFSESRPLDAIERVCEEWSFDDLLDNLRSLVEKSFLRQEDTPQGDANFVMLGTIRDYALEKLNDSGRLEILRARHADHYRDLALRAADKLRGPEQVEWIQTIEREHANFRLAMGWADERDDAVYLLDILQSVWPAWWARAHVGEGYRWAERIVSHGEGLDVGRRATARWLAAAFARLINNPERSRELNRLALQDAAEAGDEHVVGLVNKEIGNLEAHAGNYDKALEHYQIAIDIFRSIGEELGLSQALNNLGVTLTLEGRHEEVFEPLHESMAIAEKLRDKQGVARLHLNLGVGYRDIGDLSRARTHLEASLRGWFELGGIWDIVDVLGDMGALAVTEGNFERAAALLGATSGLRRSINAPAQSYEENVVHRVTETTRQALGQERFEELFVQGEKMDLEDIMSFALQPGTTL